MLAYNLIGSGLVALGALSIGSMRARANWGSSALDRTIGAQEAASERAPSRDSDGGDHQHRNPSVVELGGSMPNVAMARSCGLSTSLRRPVAGVPALPDGWCLRQADRGRGPALRSAFANSLDAHGGMLMSASAPLATGANRAPSREYERSTKLAPQSAFARPAILQSQAAYAGA